MFSWTEKDLNEDQSKAVYAEGNVFLVACPGSGKTRTLSYKIAFELSRLKSERKFIVAITYTNRAADEIKERIEKLGVDTKQLWIGTIHAFCLEWIIRPYSIYHDGLANGYVLLNSHDSQKILTEICQSRSGRRITYWDCGYYVKKDGYVLTCEDVSKHSAIHEVIKIYFDTLKDNGQIDFELILYFSFQLLLENPRISKTLGKIFPFILVDEYQDTKEIQYDLISKIISGGNSFTKAFIVGDPNQAIYQSLGGFAMKPEVLGELAGINFKKLSLALNYRSSEKIIKYFQEFNVHSTAIESASRLKRHNGLITYSNTINVENIVEKLDLKVKYFLNEEKIEPSEIAILAPWWVHLAPLTRELSSKNPELSFDGPGMVPFSRDVENFWYKLSKIILTEPSPSMYIRRLRWAGDVISHMDRVGVSLNNIDKKKILKICNSIKLNENNGMKYLVKFFESFFAKLGVDYREYTELREHLDAFLNSSNERIGRLKREGSAFISKIESFRKVFKPRSGITVSTIHGVKGAEFDVIIAFGLLEGMVPHFSDPNGEISAKKLLYVISSRARKHLCLISERNRIRFQGEQYIPTFQLLNYAYDYDDEPEGE